MEYLAPNLQNHESESIPEDPNAIHIRLGDTLAGAHPDYYPLPISVYQKVCEETGRSPAFIGEFDYRCRASSFLAGRLRDDRLAVE